MSLQKQYLRRQFGLFCWVHMTLLLIVVSRWVDMHHESNNHQADLPRPNPDSHFIVNNILEGMIWFFVPASLVICNDIFAYICGESRVEYSLLCQTPIYIFLSRRMLAGKTFGKTSLFKLSPKKTVEGFVGAFFCTSIFAVFVSPR